MFGFRGEHRGGEGAEDLGHGDVGPGATSTLSGQVTPAQVTAPGARPVKWTFKSRPSRLVQIRIGEMGQARDELETLSSLTSNCLLACNVTGTFFKGGGLEIGRRELKILNGLCFVTTESFRG